MMKKVNLMSRLEMKNVMGGVAAAGGCQVSFQSPGEPGTLPTVNIVLISVSGTCDEQKNACSVAAAGYVVPGNSNVHFDTACDGVGVAS
jgi:hypothetical protein